MKARSGGCVQQQAGETHLNNLRPPKFLTSNYLPSSGEENVIFLGGATCSQQKPRERGSWVVSTQQVTQGHFD